MINVDTIFKSGHGMSQSLPYVDNFFDKTLPSKFLFPLKNISDIGHVLEVHVGNGKR